MGIIKVLKRKDAASVILAVVIGLVVLQLVSGLTAKMAGQISGLNDGQYARAEGWHGDYLLPVVSAALQLVALEVLVWLYVGVHTLVGKKK